MRKDAAARRRQVLELAAQGLGPREVAERLQVTDRTVREHLNNPDAVAELRKVQED